MKDPIKKKPTMPEEHGEDMTVELTEEELHKVVGAGEFDDVATVDEHEYTDDITNRV